MMRSSTKDEDEPGTTGRSRRRDQHNGWRAAIHGGRWMGWSTTARVPRRRQDASGRQQGSNAAHSRVRAGVTGRVALPYRGKPRVVDTVKVRLTSVQS